MRALSLRHWLLGLGLCLAVLTAGADAGCRIVFDMGSSGIRAGASDSKVVARSDFDYLGAWWRSRSFLEAEAPTIAALRELPENAGFPVGCKKLGGGFSAWRLAADASAHELADILDRIRVATGVAALVIPQQQEGAYGFQGSRAELGEMLTTTHVLDIGGGSLQIAGQDSSHVDVLGQKIWHRELCKLLRGTEQGACALQPLLSEELASARALIADRLKPARASLAGTVSLTAISRPVSRSVFPAVKKLNGRDIGAQGFDRAMLTHAIDLLAPLNIRETANLSGIAEKYAGYLLSDMILVEGVLLATGSNELRVTELDLTNIPGLLADERAFAWEARYPCYLERLRESGIAAYWSDPQSCLR